MNWFDFSNNPNPDPNTRIFFITSATQGEGGYVFTPFCLFVTCKIEDFSSILVPFLRVQPFWLLVASLVRGADMPLIQCPHYHNTGTHFADLKRMTGWVNPLVLIQRPMGLDLRTLGSQATTITAKPTPGYNHFFFYHFQKPYVQQYLDKILWHFISSWPIKFAPFRPPSIFFFSQYCVGGKMFFEL